MDKKLQPFKHLKIQLEEITSATNNFDDEKKIGDGGFGNVYRGELSHSKGRSTVAIKRLDDSNGQGDAEFMKEITALSRYEHENLISLLGFCYEEGAEAILVYQLASHGSLEKHLDSDDLTWTLRLEICLGAAKGLRHLHDPMGTHQRLIHCDVKSANILLDDHWHAMVADFGFSTMGPANELHSTVVNRAAGTYGYCDPEYANTSTLTKESDVYSFGVVLVEVLCGALCYTLDGNDSAEYNLVPTWIKSYEEKKLNDTIFTNSAIQPMHESVLEIFSNIVYRCLKESREDRPTMEDVATELEIALNVHELLQNQQFIGGWNIQSVYYKAITKSAEPPLHYISEHELKNLLSKGVLLNGGKTYFSLNKKEEHCEMIFVVACLDSAAPSERDQRMRKYISRFPVGTYRSEKGIFKTHVKTQFLSPGITYTVNLVFKFTYTKNVRNCYHLVSLKYKLLGEKESSSAYLAYEREDGWWMCELYQFTSDRKIVDLQILFEDHLSYIEAEGIEFRPLEKVEHEEDVKQPILDLDAI